MCEAVPDRSEPILFEQFLLHSIDQKFVVEAQELDLDFELVIELYVEYDEKEYVFPIQKQ